MAPKKPKAKAARRTKDFISFIFDIEADQKLALRFLGQQSAESLHSFFVDEGYTGIPLGDCADILAAKDRWIRITVPGQGRPPCEHQRNKGY